MEKRFKIISKKCKIKKNSKIFRAKLIWKNDEKIMKLRKDHVKNVESKNFILNNE